MAEVTLGFELSLPMSFDHHACGCKLLIFQVFDLFSKVIPEEESRGWQGGLAQVREACIQVWFYELFAYIV